MNKPLANAILGTFHLQSADKHFADVASFPLSAWTDTYRWLDASGLALYFLERVKSLRQEGVLPALVLQRLERSLADNRKRTAETVAEFVRINRAITEAGVTFVNLKGLSLVPHACDDPGLRLQIDLDFLIEMRQVQACAVALDELGYVLTGISGSVWEFKGAASASDTQTQRCVELHFESGRRPELSARREWAVWEGFSVPVLSDADKFIAQAVHVLKHIRGEWTRLSCLLEFRHSVLYWKDDRDFWQQVRERAIADKELQTAIGTAIVLTTIAFGNFAPDEINSWTVDALEQRMRMWLDHYGREAMVADFPGTKLYLLQPDPMSISATTQARTRSHRLLPLHKAPRVDQGGGLVTRLRGWSAQMDFVFFRLRFHVTEGWRYMQEVPRWRRIVAAAQQPRTSLVTADERGSL